MTRSAIVLSIALLGAGCASMGEPASTGLAAAPRDASEEATARYVQRVEQQARVRGIGVTWVNPPQFRARAVTKTR